MGQHCPLWGTGRTRRVNERHPVVPASLRHERLDRASFRRPVVATYGQKLIPTHQALVVIAPDPPRLAVEDLPHARDSRLVNPQHPIDLLLILSQVNHRPAVGKQVLHLGGGIGRIEAHGDAPHGDGGEVQDHPLRPILRLDRHPVAHLDPEGQQTMGGVQNEVPHLGRRELSPDAEILLAHHHLIGHGHGVPEHLGRQRRNLVGRSGRRNSIKCRSHVHPHPLYRPADHRGPHGS